jgi:hypothetical protein
MPVLVGPTMVVRELIRRAEEQGCVLKTTRAGVMTPSGFKQVPYLYNPNTRGRYPLDDLDEDDTILAYEIELIARRLNITLP